VKKRIFKPIIKTGGLMNKFFIAIFLMGLIFQCAEQKTVPTEKPTQLAPEAFTQTSSGLRYADILIGMGSKATPGKTVTVHYTGWLENGTRFDSSVLKNRPFQFDLGAGRVIAGWDEGVAGMAVGGIRQLIIPPHLGYGSSGAGNVIPPNAILIFEVQLLGVK
jgi:FKBP-type peptidyl-prolyl cis-trans isomerase